MRYKVNEKGNKIYQRFKKINDTFKGFIENDKDILRDIQVSWEWEKIYVYEILKEIIEGNGIKVARYGFTIEDLKYIWAYPNMVWVNMEQYFEEVK
jgi:predicted nucleic-acid-binding protein